MKNLLFISLIAILFSACSSDELTQKKAELADLKKQEAEIKTKIATLVKDIAKLSGQKVTNSQLVSVTKITKSSFSHYIDVQAKVDGDENVTVNSQVPGSVTKINVSAGSTVSKGQVLAEIDNETYMKGLDELQTAREFANTVYLKQKNLWEQKIGTEIQYLQAKNTIESLDKKLATLNQQIEMTKIKSPISGVVDEVFLKLGQMAAPGMPGIRVVNMNKLKIKADIAESYISKVKTGDEVEILLPDLNQTIKAKLSYVGKVIDALNRTFNVEISLPANSSLHPNMVAVIKIADYTNTSTFVLPANVVQITDEGTYVFVAENNIARKRNVVVGKNYKGTIEITEGLNENDPIITTGFQDIVDGQSITVN
jgi:membrane fusion protein (multidrug efflux system)